MTAATEGSMPDEGRCVVGSGDFGGVELEVELLKLELESEVVVEVVEAEGLELRLSSMKASTKLTSSSPSALVEFELGLGFVDVELGFEAKTGLTSFLSPKNARDF